MPDLKKMVSTGQESKGRGASELLAMFRGLQRRGVKVKIETFPLNRPQPLNEGDQYDCQ
jgi:hypothetical protein